MKFCGACGFRMADDMIFCPKCGKKRDGAREMVPPYYSPSGIQAPTAAKKNGRIVGVIVAIFIFVIFCILLGATIENKSGEGNRTDNSDVKQMEKAKSGEDYESDVFTVFWESASEFLGVEYYEYKFTETACSWIEDFTTSDGYTSHYYLIQTAYETENAFGKKEKHPVTARCYYVPEYSNVVYTTYVTLDGKKVLFDEETEDWLMGMGSASAPKQ